MDSPVPLMHHDPDRSWITDSDPDHPKGTQPKGFSTKMHMVVAIKSLRLSIQHYINILSQF